MVPNDARSLTATGTIHTGPGVFKGINICAGADAATATVYDNTSAAGRIICKVGAAIGLSKESYPPGGVLCSIGIHVVITGTTPQVNVYV